MSARVGSSMFFINVSNLIENIKLNLSLLLAGQVLTCWISTKQRSEGRFIKETQNIDNFLLKTYTPDKLSALSQNIKTLEDKG